MGQRQPQTLHRATSDEFDQWISKRVVSICDRAGIPVERTISVRCICTWKPPESPLQTDVQKARLVVRGDIDLALTSVRSEAPTHDLSAQLRSLVAGLFASSLVSNRSVKPLHKIFLFVVVHGCFSHS